MPDRHPARQRLESVRWQLAGDRLVFSDPSPEEECDDFRGVAVFQPWERVPDGQP